MTKDQEVVEMIDEVLSETNPDIQLDLLKNIFSYPKYQEMTVKEILLAELTAKEDFEKELASRRNQ